MILLPTTCGEHQNMHDDNGTYAIQTQKQKPDIKGAVSDLCSKTSPQVVFRGQHAANSAPRQPKVLIKFNLAYFLAKDLLFY